MMIASGAARAGAGAGADAGVFCSMEQRGVQLQYGYLLSLLLVRFYGPDKMI
jgi:hypothetical protein